MQRESERVKVPENKFQQKNADVAGKLLSRKARCDNLWRKGKSKRKSATAIVKEGKSKGPERHRSKEEVGGKTKAN